MPKERSINPAQAERKKEKAKQIKKGKAEQQARRNEQLSRKNPDRLQKQLDDLKAIETSGGKLTSHEKKVSEELERDIKAIRKARDILGDKAPPLRPSRPFNDRDGGRDSGRGGGVLGKRTRDGEKKWIDGDSTEESEVDDEVKRIPMPRDTPPPIPKEILDKWHQKRRQRLGISNNTNDNSRNVGGQGTSANNMPLGANRRGAPHIEDSSSTQPPPTTPAEPAKTVYSAAPAIRDLRKEATSAFIPAAVRIKMEKGKGVGGLVEPEEADRLEKEGYMGRQQAPRSTLRDPRAVQMEEVEDEDD